MSGAKLCFAQAGWQHVENSSSLTDVVDIWREEEYFFIDSSRGEQIAPMVLLVTLSRCPRFCLERCHNAVPPPVGGLLPGRGSRALSFVRNTAASPATTLRLTPQRVLAAAIRRPRYTRSCGEQITPTVSFVTLSAMPAIQPRLKHQRDIPHRQVALLRRARRALSLVCNTVRGTRDFVANDATARLGCGDSPPAA